ncbi:hypothetical protein TNCV_4277491 [Trichonephila clavipes]|nr:hypothetical protein TNCV_4277491 [Trichonephila clavipes]
MVLGYVDGYRSLVVMVTNSLPMCHEFEPCTPEDPPYREGRWTINMLKFKRPPVDVVRKLGKRVTATVTYSSLHHGAQITRNVTKSPRVAE